MRIRIPLNGTAMDHQLNIMTIYKKFRPNYNYVSDDNSDKNKTIESKEIGDEYDIFGVKSSHPCSKELLLEKQACGMKNKKCEHEIFGVPRKFIEYVLRK